MEKKAYSVSELNSLIKENLEIDPGLANVWVEGEITNLRFYQLGKQLYFNLSDGKAQINCVVFASSLPRFKNQLKEGLSAIAFGKVQYYQKRGTVSFQVFYLMPKGEGLLSKKFEELKAKLLKEGIFDKEHKKPIPPFPTNIALITAYDSAAMWDFITISRKLVPHLKLSVIPAVMQGTKCSKSITEALDLAEEQEGLDLLVVLRGGGSAEDLAGFNDENLVRRIAANTLPIISAVGHEIDYTLTDFAADLRMPTPTAAAQKVAENYLHVQENISQNIKFIFNQIAGQIIDFNEQYFDLLKNLEENMEDKILALKDNVSALFHRLGLANPVHKLEQGYSICRKADTNKVVKTVTSIKNGDLILTELKDGKLKSKVLGKEK
ncbi:exodeoxyribonuclease VII large subunit [Candidatus Margulisiibacteriota bacterium]